MNEPKYLVIRNSGYTPDEEQAELNRWASLGFKLVGVRSDCNGASVMYLERQEKPDATSKTEGRIAELERLTNPLRTY